MAIDVAVLVSVGRHPASLRARRAEGDARALELAIRLGRVHLIHAGNPAESALRDYSGMGVDEMTVLKLPERADPVPALAQYLKTLRPDLILTGARAEHGPSSGALPYAIAAALDYPLVAAVAGIELQNNRARLLQALPRGRRRGVAAPLPLLATVDQAAPPARQSAYARARRAKLSIIEVAQTTDTSPSPPMEERPARVRPKRLKVTSGGSAAQRLQAASRTQAGRGALLVDPQADIAAKAIYDYLVEEGILKS